jgi:hypothetical protein
MSDPATFTEISLLETVTIPVISDVNQTSDVVEQQTDTKSYQLFNGRSLSFLDESDKFMW